MAGLVKCFIRGVGTLGAVMGVLMLMRWPIMVRGMGEYGVGPVLAFLAVPTLIAAYAIWIGYLVWFRFSPRAVQQCCGLLGLFVLALASALLYDGDEADQTMPWAVGMLAALVAVLWGYRQLSRAFNRVLFPAAAASVVVGEGA